MKRLGYKKMAAVLTAFSLLMAVLPGFGEISFAEGKKERLSGSENRASVSDDVNSTSENGGSVSDDLGGISDNEKSLPKDSSSDDMDEWTVLMYMCGTDLETKSEAASENLREIAETWPEDAVNVLIQTGGTREWHAGDLGIDIDPGKTQRYSYDEEGFSLVDEVPLENMASPETLSEFITWGTRHYPAKKYMLLLWDHGGGSVGGLIVDEIHNNAMMTVYDVEKALDKAGTDFEVITVDCCLMASLEMAGAVKEHCRYMVASEEEVPGYGCAYNEWLQYLYDIPECDGKEFGTQICDSIQQKYVELGDDMSAGVLTFSVIDLGEIEGVERAFDDFFTEIGKMTKDPVEYSNYMYCSRLAEEYGEGDFGMVDLIDLADKARENDILEDEAARLRSAVGRAVVYNVKGNGRSYSHGLSYYDGTKADPSTLDTYLRLAGSMPYLAYLDAVHMDWRAPDWVYEDIEPIGDITYDDYGVDTEVAIGDDGELELIVNEGMMTILSVDYRLYRENEDGGWDLLGTGEHVGAEHLEEGIFTADFSGTWPAIGDEFCSMEIDDETEAYVRYRTPVLVEKVDEDNPESAEMEGELLNLASALIKGDPEKEEDPGEYYEIYGFMKDRIYIENTRLPGRGTYSLGTMDDAEIRLLYPAQDPITGAEIYTKGGSLTVSRNLMMEEKELPAGEYGYSFVVTDVMGNQIETEMAYLSWDGEYVEYTLPGEEEPEEDEESVSDNEAEPEEDGSVSDNDTGKDRKRSVSGNDTDAEKKGPVSDNDTDVKKKGSVSENDTDKKDKRSVSDNREDKKEKRSASENKADRKKDGSDTEEKDDPGTEDRSDKKDIKKTGSKKKAAETASALTAELPRIEDTILITQPYGNDFDYASYYRAYAEAWKEFNP